MKKREVKKVEGKINRKNRDRENFTHPSNLKLNRGVVKLNNEVNRKFVQPNFIYKNFQIAFKDLKKIKSYFWFSFILFFVTGFFGFLFPVFFEEQILKIITELIKKTEGLGVFGLIRFIIANNTQSAFFGMILGIFLGIFPLGVLIVNGYVLGFVVSKTVALEGFLVMWRLLPHGIFEIPAILISVALGLRLGFLLMYDCMKSYNKDFGSFVIGLLMFLSILFFPIAFLIYMVFVFRNIELKKKVFKNFLDSFRIFILIVVPLLVIAGIIEGVLIWWIG